MAVGFRTIDHESLVDINDVVIDRILPKVERIKSFAQKIKKPYCFKCGNIVIKTSFLDIDKTLEDSLEYYLRNL